MKNQSTPDHTEGRVPPYDREAERAILGAVLLNNYALEKVRASLTAEDFYVEAHRRVYVAMIDMAMRSEPVDHVTLGSELIKRGDMEKIGGPMALDGLTDSVATIANVDHYAEIVRRKAAVRRMIYAAQEVAASGFANSGSEEEYLEGARSSVARAAQFAAGDGPVKIDQDLSELWNELQQAGDPPGLVKTGIDIIDRVTGGLWAGQLYVVAGRPGMGKSAFGVNIATNVALGGKKVLYITMEDVRKFVVRRMLARFADIDLHDLTLRNVRSPEQWKRITDAMTRLNQQHPLWLEDSGGLTSSAVAQIAAAHRAIHGLDLLVVDHLSEYADTGESETSITTRAAQRTRDVAKELSIPVILLAQLNRKVEERPNKRPMLPDLRQSGAIEQVARNVWFLYRPSYYSNDEDADERRDLELIVAKASHGKTGTLRLWVDLSRMYVRSWDAHTDGAWPESPPGATGQKKDYFGASNAAKSQSHWQDKETEY